MNGKKDPYNQPQIPNKTFTVNKKANHISSVPPVRQWPVETYSNSNYNHKGQSDAYQSQVVYPHQPPMTTNRPNQPDRAQPRRPERIEKVSYKVSASGQDGEVELEQEATYEDDMEVYRSTAYKKKIKRLQKLQERTNKGVLDSAKKEISTRFVITKQSWIKQKKMLKNTCQRTLMK